MVKDSHLIDVVAAEVAATPELDWVSTEPKPSKGASREDQLVLACARRMDQVSEIHPDWFAYFDDVQALSAMRTDVAELLRCAPTEFTRGLMYGIYLMRSEIALITGREFK